MEDDKLEFCLSCSVMSLFLQFFLWLLQVLEVSAVRDVCLLLSVMELDGTQLVVLKYI